MSCTISTHQYGAVQWSGASTRAQRSLVSMAGSRYKPFKPLQRASITPAASSPHHQHAHGRVQPHLQPHAPRQQHTNAAAAAASASFDPSLQPDRLHAPARQPHFRPHSVLPLVSSAVESSAELSMFESFAGRSAMGGCLGWKNAPAVGRLGRVRWAGMSRVGF